MDCKTCIGCGGTWPISFFHIHKKGRKRARCMGCIRRRPNDYLVKARNSIARHAKSFGLDRPEFSQRFGWHSQRMADDLKHAASGKCPYCQNQTEDYRTMTFDVIDPAKPPNYSANVRICCLQCNVAKKSMSPEAWAERLDTWSKYREWIDSIRKNPVVNLPLFKDM